MKVSYLMLVEHTQENIRCRSLVSVPIHLSAQLADDEQKLVAYCRQQGYEEPKLLIKRILMNSLISVNGSLGRLMSKTNKSLFLSNARQLHLSIPMEAYFKRVIRFCERAAISQKFHPNQPIQVNAMDGISQEENISAYVELWQKMEKLHGRLLKRLVNKLKNAQPAFQHLNIERQCYVLKQILQLWTESSSQTADLRDIGLSKDTGAISINSKISEYSEVTLFLQSVTGLFDEPVNLLKP